jgi:predicted GIY-YIG superfamily endonuclease
MNTFYVYILKCSDNSYYVGHTDNMEKRFSEHNLRKFSGYTSRRLPLKLMFIQTFNTHEEAFLVERKIKKWSRVKKEALISKNWEQLTKLARCKKSLDILRQAQDERSEE